MTRRVPPLGPRRDAGRRPAARVGLHPGDAVAEPEPEPQPESRPDRDGVAGASPSRPRPSPDRVPVADGQPPSATPAADCVVEPQEGPLSSDRMTDVKVSSTADADIITFVFGRASLPGPAGQPRGDLAVAEPPYTEAGSGEPIKMQGDHVLQLRFMHMSLSADTGDPTYDGPRELQARPAGAAPRGRIRRVRGPDRLVHRLRRTRLRHARP